MLREREIMTTHGHAELDQTLAVDGLTRNHRDAELVFQARDADVERRVHREIHHVQDEEDGPAEIENLVNEIEVSLQIRGIDNAENPIRLRRVSATTEETVARDGSIRRTRGERVRARQIDDSHRLTVLRKRRADFLFDRDTRIIADLLLEASERVEERALAAVRIAN